MGRALTVLDNVIAPVLPYPTGWGKRERARQLLAAEPTGNLDSGNAAEIVDDIQLTAGRPAQEIIRHAGQLG